MKTVVEMMDGTKSRLSLPVPCWTGLEEINTGVRLKAVYAGKKSRRVIIETYSQWVDRKGACTGTQYKEVDPLGFSGYIPSDYMDKIEPAKEL